MPRTKIYFHLPAKNMLSDTFVPQNQIESETGFSRDQLRKWRERFGFPPKELTFDGKSAYSIKTVKQLLLIKRLIEAGFRPAQVLNKSFEELEELILGIGLSVVKDFRDDSILKLLESVKRADIATFKDLLQIQRSTKSSLFTFIQETLAPLMVSLGQAWRRGEIDVFHEHLCTSHVERYLNGEILKCDKKDQSPTILFAVPPGENHLLGLSMIEAVLTEQGAKGINVGSHIPIHSLCLAAKACAADVVVLSFSFAYPLRNIHPTLMQLRRLLPSQVQVWVGGAGLSGIRRQPKGVEIFRKLEDAVKALHQLKFQSAIAA